LLNWFLVFIGILFILFVLQKAGIIWRDDAIGIHNFHKRNYATGEWEEKVAPYLHYPHIDYCIEVFGCTVYHVCNVPPGYTWTPYRDDYIHLSHTNARSIRLYVPDYMWMLVNSNHYYEMGVKKITAELLAYEWNENEAAGLDGGLDCLYN
jgi:hypothetical protein